MTKITDNMKNKLYIGLVCLTVLIAGVLVVRSNTSARSYGATMPKVGDKAYYNNDPKGFLCVSCIKAEGKKRMLKVTYRKFNHKEWKSAYTVQINYGASYRDADRVSVWDSNGAVVTRGRSVNGVPNPFHSLLFVSGEKLPKTQRLVHTISDGCNIHIASGSGGSPSLTPPTEPHYIRFDFDNGKYGWSDSCFWGGSDWIFCRIARNSTFKDVECFDIERCEKPESKAIR